MSEEVRHHIMSDGRSIAYRNLPGAGPTLVFLPGYMSDMAGSKATALLDWAKGKGRACLLFDYSGCGESNGDFANGTLTRWRDEALSLIASEVQGPVILIGSSMGGWLMLLIGEALGERLAGMVGIAAAPDFTQWGRSDEDTRRLKAGETVYDANPYGPDPTPMHARFYRDAQSLLRLDKGVEIRCPVCLLHGQQDPDVPWEISLKLAQALRSDTVQVTLVKDGDHRLSRPQDIALLLRIVSTFCEG